MDRREVVACEDLVMFINACFACTSQREFHGDRASQSVSIGFLHAYMLGNYRRVYARTLSTGINHFNQARIIVNLLASGRDVADADRGEEGALIATALRRLPAHRAYQVLEELRVRGVNNRRTRAIVREFLDGRRDISLDAVKYRNKLRSALLHNHLRLPGELHRFVREGLRAKRYDTPLLEQFRRAHYAADAVYSLPWSVAEGLAQRFNLDRGAFLERMAPRMTANERLRLQETARRNNASIDVDPSTLGLTRLALYTLSLPVDVRRTREVELRSALDGAAQRVVRRTGFALGRAAVILDASHSSSGSEEKRRRPLGVALAVERLLRQACTSLRVAWTAAPETPLMVRARGQTALAEPLIDAIAWGAETILMVSDGYENDPPGGVHGVMNALVRRVRPRSMPFVVHINPVFDPEEYRPRTLSAHVPTVGVRDAEDLPTVLAFARLAAGRSSLADLEAHLARRVRAWLGTRIENVIPAEVLHGHGAGLGSDGIAWA